MFTGLKEEITLGDSILGNTLSKTHELVQLKHILDWKQMNEIYKSCFPSEKGNATKKTDLVLGLLILKHYYKMSDRGVIKMLHENIAFMYFCSVSPEEIGEYNRRNERMIDHSTLVRARRRLGKEKVRQLEALFRQSLLAAGIVDGKYLFTDTTSVEDNICYPTEVSLLKRVIEHAEMVVQKVVKKKDLIKSEVIKTANTIAKVYYSTAKKTKELLKSTTKQMVKIAVKVIEKADEVVKAAGKKISEKVKQTYTKVKEVGVKIVAQVTKKLAGKKVSDKIVSYYEPHARALPKGKVGKPCEFGVKLRLDMSRNKYITNYKVYEGNPSDATMLEEAVALHAQIFGEDFKAGAADRAFYDAEKIAALNEEYDIDFVIPHKKDRSKKLTKRRQRIYDKRSAEEAKISEGKRMCRLGKSLYKGLAGDEMWTSMSVWVLNMRTLVRDITRRPKLLAAFSI